MSDELGTCTRCKKHPAIIEITISFKTDLTHRLCIGCARQLIPIKDFDEAVTKIILAIRERDKKLAQSMTVEEANDWHHEWMRIKPTQLLKAFYILKIKERNEKARKDGGG